jgi:hypothetical protein
MQNRVATAESSDLLWVEPTYMNQRDKRLFDKREAWEEGTGLKKLKHRPQIRLERSSEKSVLSRPPLEAARSIVVLEPGRNNGRGLNVKTLEEPGSGLILSSRQVEVLPLWFPAVKKSGFLARESPNQWHKFYSKGDSDFESIPR